MSKESKRSTTNKSKKPVEIKVAPLPVEQTPVYANIVPWIDTYTPTATILPPPPVRRSLFKRIGDWFKRLFNR